MKRPVAAFALTQCLLPLAGCEAPPPPAPPQREYTIDQFLATTTYRGASFSADGTRLLVSSDASGVLNAYALDVAGGGDPVPLTASTTDSVFAESYFPGDDRLVVRSDQGGNELDHLYVRELDGSLTDLTPGDKVKAAFLGWTDDHQSLLFATNERDPRYFDAYAATADGYERTLLFHNEEGHDFSALSPDERYVALTKTETEADSDVYLFDREAGGLELLTPHEGDIRHEAQTFSPDGRALYYLTDAGSEFTYLARFDLAGGERREVLREDWDVEWAAHTPSGRYLVASVNRDARSELRVLDATTLESLPAPSLPDADLSDVAVSLDDTRLAFYATSSQLPRDLFVWDFAGGEARQVTRSLSPDIDPAHLVEGEVVRFAAPDGVEIPGILYRPHGASADARVPALVWVHGGPGGQSRLGYSALLQYLVHHGYAVYAINNRGSSGYGKTFHHLDDRRHGEGDLDDCVASKGMLAATGWVDSERIGILGGSYGGFMVLAALAFRPEEFDAGVDLFGISNWHRTVQSIPPWWESFRNALEQEMGDFDDEEFFRAKSPLFHAERIVRPLMVLQGKNDPRVLQQESDDIVAAAQANGVPVEYLVFEDEGHGFEKKENQRRGYRAILEFLDRHLAAGGTAERRAA